MNGPKNCESGKCPNFMAQLGFDFQGFISSSLRAAREFEEQKEAFNNLPPLFKDGQVYCPLCARYFSESDYLSSVISDPSTRWIANNITHYRHNHISSWNKCWGYGGGRYRSRWFGSYEDEKRKVNERAKRQILRKAGLYMKIHGITSKHFQGLQHNDDETLALARATLG